MPGAGAWRRACSRTRHASRRVAVISQAVSACGERMSFSQAHQLQPAGLHHVGGFLGGQALGPGHPPQQRVQLGHDLAHRGLIPGPGLLEGHAEPGRAVGCRVARAGLRVSRAGSPATERHSRHATAAPR